MAHHSGATTADEPGSIWKSRPGYKPLIIVPAAILFIVLVIMPPPQGMIDLVSMEKPSGYSLPSDCKNITDSVNRKLSPAAFKAAQKGQPLSNSHGKGLLAKIEAAQLAKVMLLIFCLAVLFWGTEALPLGATDLMVAVMLYLFSILPMEEIGKAYMSDAVFFIFGILAVAVGVAKTGLDKRIGLILLSRIHSAKGFALIFMPLLAMAASFLSEHALVALLIPVLLGIYKVTCRMYGVEKDRALAVFLLLGICFAANHGGPGSPAAGGRNAIMVGYLMEQGIPISFLEWMKYGMPFVPLMGVVIGAYMYIMLKPKFKVKDMNPGEVVRSEVARMPKFGGKEALMAVILVLLVAAWVILGEHSGLGGADPLCGYGDVSGSNHYLG